MGKRHPVLTDSQYTHLLQSINDAHTAVRYAPKLPKEPAAVTKARKLAKDWDSQVSVLRDEHAKRTAGKKTLAIRALEFAKTPEEAVEVVTTYLKDPA